MSKTWLIPHGITALGILLILLSTILGWIVIPKVIDSKIKEEVRLVENSKTWNKWVKIPIPIYLKFYIFNVTNPEEIEIGKNPNLEEFGPYVYEEVREKFDISIYEDTDTVEYKQKITYHFREEMSIGSEFDKYNTVNTPFIALSTVLSSSVPLFPGFMINFVINLFLSEGERLVRHNVTVRDLIFDGVPLAPIYRLVNLLPASQRPPEFANNKFAYYRNKNGSDDGIYEVKTGITNSEEFGKVVRWNGKERLDYWRNPDWMDQDPNNYCNMINGTDGTIFPPFVKKDTRLDLFITDVCRSLYVKYDSEMEHMDIPGYKFIFPEEFYLMPSINEDNYCFCTSPPGNLIDICNITGAFRLFPCKSGAPIITSSPHFLDSEQLFLDRVDGLVPVREKHETYVELEPNSGLALRISKKVQISLEMQALPGVQYFENIVHYAFPAFWADEYAELDETNADELKSMLLIPLKIVNISKWTVLVIGCITLALGVGLYFRFKSAKQKNLQST